MTLFYMEIDPATRSAAYARAGHDPALRHNPITGQTTELTCRGMILGATDDACYETGHVADLAPGEILLIGSDGLWEARNAADEMFGKERTREVLAAAAPGGPQAVCDALMAALDAFRGDVPLADDVTLLAAAVTEGSAVTDVTAVAPVPDVTTGTAGTESGQPVPTDPPATTGPTTPTGTA